MRTALVATCLLALLVGLTTTASGKEGSKLRRPATGQLGSDRQSESPAAARVGRTVLENGGNAVDAAAATVFAIGVARPQSCGIGGGGFMVYRSARARTDALDFRETAPAAFRPRTLKSKGLHTDFTGHLTVGVPGTVAGMQAMLERYGTTSLAQAASPAERLARRGVRVTPELAATIRENVEAHQALPRHAAAVPAPRQAAAGRVAAAPAGHGRHPAADHPQRAARLLPRRERAPDRGRHAPRLRAQGRPRHHAPARPGALRGQVARRRCRAASGAAQIVAMPPPTSGGIAVLQMLNVLEGFDLRASGQSSADSLHTIIEAQKQAFADRGEYVGDPGFVRVPTRRLISKDYAAQRRALIRPDRARRTYQPGLGPRGSGRRLGRRERAAPPTSR